ncbi:hypothetical protein MQE22_13670 (plasmid) [Acidithiobacillus sp. YTS05]|nr:hypothetical protein MQE22_13670 [Acidithiobacillus sp. YTS05]
MFAHKVTLSCSFVALPLGVLRQADEVCGIPQRLIKGMSVTLPPHILANASAISFFFFLVRKKDYFRLYKGTIDAFPVRFPSARRLSKRNIAYFLDARR